MEAVAIREAAVLVRELAADRRDGAAEQRDGAAEQRDEAAEQRDELAEQREVAAKAKADLGAHTDALMLEVNERLVVATVHAQTMSDAAEQASDQMSYMAKHDFLTGLPNRSLLTDLLVQSIELAERHDKRVALMYLDLDHFKHVNDSLGHAVGDLLLQSVARRLLTCVRQSDTVCRQGGDEFVVLLAEVEAKDDAAVCAEKLIHALAIPHLIDGHRLHVTLSIGISLYPDDGKDIEALFGNADIAMYHAKNNGRNKYHIFTPDMNVRANTRQSVAMALHQALEEREFVLHYQPKVNLKTGTITGAEALVRMKQPHNRLAYPMQFVSVAEDSGLILPIGKWVLHEACCQTAAWLQAGLDVGLMSVNVSAAEFFNKDFLAGVREVLEDTGLDPHHLELELTESGLMRDTELTKANLHAIKEFGVQIAIDDFGTGYSSLSYLRSFPIDTLKIDQSFVSDLDGDTTAATIVSTIIAMGKSLKKRVVAEGVETQHQLAFLQRHQCDEGQGYYFSRPVAAEEFATLLVASRHWLSADGMWPPA
jgi:diguanylate cyclase (GGDEF)-like protein